MKECLVAKLDKEDVGEYKQIERDREQLEEMTMAFHSKVAAFWEELRKKYNLSPGGHYIKKDRTIYKQVKE